LDFGRVEGRSVVADFSGGTITSNAGALLLAQADRAVVIIDSFAACFSDERNQGLIEHTVRTLVGQRIVGIALGHEDLVDHEELRHDPVLAAMLGKLTPRRKECAPLAGKSTLSRLEHSPQEGAAHAPPVIAKWPAWAVRPPHRARAEPQGRDRGSPSRFSGPY
jgi:hypothetical protein